MPTITTPDVAYRYEAMRVSLGADELDQSVGYDVAIALRTYPILRYTPKGYWLDLGWGTPRFVRALARKRFASLTIREAKISFLARKARQIQLLEGQLEYARRQLAKFETMQHQ